MTGSNNNSVTQSVSTNNNTPILEDDPSQYLAGLTHVGSPAHNWAKDFVSYNRGQNNRTYNNLKDSCRSISASIFTDFHVIDSINAERPVDNARIANKLESIRRQVIQLETDLNRRCCFYEELILRGRCR